MVSFWDGLFSGAMLVSGVVKLLCLALRNHVAILPESDFIRGKLLVGVFW